MMMMTMIVMMMLTMTMIVMMMMTAVLTIMLHQFGRALRIALFNKMNRSALRIQQAYRRASVGMMTLLRTRQIRLALILQKLYRGRVGKEALRRLRMEALQRVAAASLQRVYRGYLGDREIMRTKEIDTLLYCASLYLSCDGSIWTVYIDPIS